MCICSTVSIQGKKKIAKAICLYHLKIRMFSPEIVTAVLEFI